MVGSMVLSLFKAQFVKKVGQAYDKATPRGCPPSGKQRDDAIYWTKVYLWESLNGGMNVQPKNVVCLEAAPAEAPIEVKAFPTPLEKVNSELLQASLGQVPNHAASGFSAVVSAVEDEPEQEQKQAGELAVSLHAKPQCVPQEYLVILGGCERIALRLHPNAQCPRTGMEQSLLLLVEVWSFATQCTCRSEATSARTTLAPPKQLGRAAKRAKERSSSSSASQDSSVAPSHSSGSSRGLPSSSKPAVPPPN
ncbi:MAG: hypothetical protein SGPRY_000018 [Prymnesium sp.]